MKLLGHFIEMAEEAFGHDNIITVMCKELQKDEYSRNDTELALRCMLGSMQLAHFSSVLNTERAMNALMRRDIAFDDAAQLAETLLRSNNTSAKSKSEDIRQRSWCTFT